jgi:hypothetical protein
MPAVPEADPVFLLYHKTFVARHGFSVCNRRKSDILYHALGTMKLDDWLMRLVAVRPGRSPLANGLAIGMRIALFILIPLGIIAAIAIVLLHR